MIRLICLLVCLALELCAGHAKAAPGACDDPKPLRFSLVPRTDMAKLLEEYQPLVQLLERILDRKIAVIQPSSYGTVVEGLVAGTIDLASMGPASYSLAKNRDPSIMPFVTWTMQGGTFVKAGSHTYNSLLITRQDSDLKVIGDLKGRSLSLTDPASSSGAVIPREEFGRLIGKRLEDYFGRVIYSGSHDRSVESIRKGYSDAAFVASEHLDEVIRQGRIEARELRVLWQSDPIPHDPFVFRGKLCSPLKDKIRQAFLTDAPEIRKLLENLKADRFVPVSDQDYSKLQEVLTRGRQ
jgi:phosphonate transport system substrate-binding protein